MFYLSNIYSTHYNYITNSENFKRTKAVTKTHLDQSFLLLRTSEKAQRNKSTYRDAP